MITPALASWYVLYPLTAMFVFVCLLLIGVVLIQKPKGGGLSGEFGGGASSAQSAFGARTGDLLTWFTVGDFAVFLVLSIILTIIARPESEKAVVATTQASAPSGMTTSTPTPAPASESQTKPANR